LGATGAKNTGCKEKVLMKLPPPLTCVSTAIAIGVGLFLGALLIAVGLAVIWGGRG
jgi:hypothetical protein